MIDSIGSYWNSRSQVHLLPFLGQYRMVLYEFNTYTCGIPIALAIHSFDPLGLWIVVVPRIYKPAAPLGLKCVGFRDFIELCNQHNAFQEREPQS